MKREDPGLIREGIIPGSSRYPTVQSSGGSLDHGHKISCGTHGRSFPYTPLRVSNAPVALAVPAWLIRCCRGGECQLSKPRKNGTGGLGTASHLDLVAVGPIGPIIQIIVGSDFFCKQLSGDEKKDGQGHEDFHVGFLEIGGRNQVEKNIAGGYPRIKAAEFSIPQRNSGPIEPR